MNLFFDTETSGFPDRQLSLTDPRQPHLVQLAALLAEDDGTVVAQFSYFVEAPELGEMPEQASDVHGITFERLIKFGVDREFALRSFSKLYTMSDQIVAHNIGFDCPILEIAIARQYGAERPLTRDRYCTMEVATPIVDLPPTERMKAKGMDQPKAAKLEECVRHFFNEDLDGAHDAMTDVTACKRVFDHLKTLEAA